MRLLLSTTLSAFIATVLASPSVTIDAGTLQGGKCSDNPDAVYYKGIPFAEPPIGELRFEAPKPYDKKLSNGVFNATTPAKNCIQFGDEMTPPGPKSEDCLYLDVWAPSSATKDSNLPVKVWVYGGSDRSGGIEYPLYDGCNSASKDSIIVLVNYRLGALGFLALNSAGIHGNQGIQDILLALKWVQKSISAFGGDPKKVLLFGQSAGATDVYAIATLPEAPSLINSAILESVALPPLRTNSSMQKTGASFAQTLGCNVNDKSCLQSKSPAELQKAFDSDPYMHKGLGTVNGVNVPNRNTHKIWPYVDGTIISENPLTRGSQVPIIIGFNQQEGIMDSLTTYDKPAIVASLTAANYTAFLRGNFGPATQTIEKYYPLSLFESAAGSTGLGVLEAIAHVITDAEYRCPSYQAAVHSTRKNTPVWMYEFTHNSTCAWLDTVPQSAMPLMGAAHTAEIPYVFGNMHFDFPSKGTNCTNSRSEHDLSNEMISLWTAMAENAKPSTDEIHWPQFKITPKPNAPGMVFGNSSMPGEIDFSVCKLWAQVDAMLNGNNSTATGTPSSSSSGNPTVSPTVSPINGAVTVSTTSGSVIFSALLTAAATFGYTYIGI